MKSRMSRGNIMMESLLALMCVSALSLALYTLCQLQSQIDVEDEDVFMVEIYWQQEKRCKIYCPLEEPLVDIAF